MRRVALAFLGTITALVMLLSFKTHATSLASPPAAISTPTPGASSGSTSAAAASGSTGSSSAKSSSAKSSSAASSSAATKTVTGDAVDTRFGPVQVTITVSNGKITSATAVEYPQSNPRDAEINSYAIPILQQESVGQSSANLDMVSGATYTSDGYLQSLQSALDKA